MIYTLENLEVFTLSESFGDKIWFEVIKWTYFEKDTVGKQLVKSADSISANIAEGYGRYTFKEDTRFLHIARGSATESKSWLRKCKRRRLMKEEIAEELLSELEIILKKINAYINFVEKGTTRNQRAINK